MVSSTDSREMKAKRNVVLDDQGNPLEDVETAPQEAVPEEPKPEDETIGG